MREQNLSWIIGIFLTALLLFPTFSWPQESGSICVAPLPKPIDGRHAAGGSSARCSSENYSFKIDARPPHSWPEKESTKIDNASFTARHRIVVFCGAKPMQSFTFVFSDYKSRELCLFLNDLYWT
ncbi:MAG TPA: hypothetical protein VKL99_03990, partial [Candidatus Angelobacter sp.]|nr:hypothetical protein [Candidatus Angelobacter sp.]